MAAQVKSHIVHDDDTLINPLSPSPYKDRRYTWMIHLPSFLDKTCEEKIREDDGNGKERHRLFARQMGKGEEQTCREWQGQIDGR